MARPLQWLRRVVGLAPPSKPVPVFARSLDLDFAVFREGDRVLINERSPILTKPLKKGQKTEIRRGTFLSHDNIIGQRVRNRVRGNKNDTYRLTLPNFDEYVSLTPRLVTPIYAPDASLIVSLLDIHIAPPAPGDQDQQPPLEILEAGTGHGSLTLHLARAIQGANTTPPARPIQSQIQELQGRPIQPSEATEAAKKEEKKDEKEEKEPDTEATTKTPADKAQEEYDTWRSHRRAIIHTVDVSPKFSAHAEKIVTGFRRGLYAGNVDFYVGGVETWIAEEKKKRQPAASLSPFASKKVEPFLSYALLDMPAVQWRIPNVAPILKQGGVLTVFVPSVTQIGDCLELIRKQNLPFALEKVVELGVGISSGRLWDVRHAVKKSRADPSTWSESSDESTGQQDTEGSVDGASAPLEEASKEESVLVCRPKVGARIVGGGFIGIWTRI